MYNTKNKLTIHLQEAQKSESLQYSNQAKSQLAKQTMMYMKEYMRVHGKIKREYLKILLFDYRILSETDNQELTVRLIVGWDWIFWFLLNKSNILMLVLLLCPLLIRKLVRIK